MRPAEPVSSRPFRARGSEGDENAAKKAEPQHHRCAELGRLDPGERREGATTRGRSTRCNRLKLDTQRAHRSCASVGALLVTQEVGVLERRLYTDRGRAGPRADDPQGPLLGPPREQGRIGHGVGEPDHAFSPLPQLRRLSVEEHLALPEDHDIRADGGDVLHEVGAEHDCPIRGQAADELAEPHPLLGVEPASRLVEQQQFRVGNDRLRDADTATHAARQSSDLLASDIGQPDGVDGSPDATMSLGPVIQLLQDCDVVDELEDSEARVVANLLG